MNEPLSVDSQELMSEGVSLNVLDEDPMREIFVKLVDRWNINAIDSSILNLPDVEIVWDQRYCKLHNTSYYADNNDKGGDNGVGKWIVLVSQ